MTEPASSPETERRNPYALPPRTLLRRFVLYETKTVRLLHVTTARSKHTTIQRFYLVGSNEASTRFRVLKVDRSRSTELSLVDDDTEYDGRQMKQLLAMIHEGNRSSGGLRRVRSCLGLVGFISFLEGYYMLLITRATQVAQIGPHAVYHVDDTALERLSQKESSLIHPDEARCEELTV